MNLMERAIEIRMKRGVEAAARWLQAQGISRELAIFALVGSRHSPRYGVKAGDFWQRRGRS